MIGELASAIPAEGGFYIWVRRALGPFWGYQESWLSLSASIFDMALYPAIFVLYLGKFSPALTAGWKAYALVPGGCSALQLVEPARRRRPWARTRSGCSCCCWLPFAIFVVLGFWRGVHAASRRAMEQPAFHEPHQDSAPAPLSRRRSWSPCGTTWAGTTPQPWLRRSRIRSATTHAP